MNRIILTVAIIAGVSSLARAQTALGSLRAGAAASGIEIMKGDLSLPLPGAPGTAKEAGQVSVWLSAQTLNKNDATALAAASRKAFERAGITVIESGVYNSFEVTGFFKYKAKIKYVGDFSLVGSYRSPWCRTEAERDALRVKVSSQLAGQGHILLDSMNFREGGGSGPMSYVFEIQYIIAKAH